MTLKSNFERRHESNQDDTRQISVEYYSTSIAVRKIRFVQLDGSCRSLSYSLLLDLGYEPDQNIITLVFTVTKVRIAGYNLMILYDEIEQEMVKKIICSNERYNILSKSTVIINKLEYVKIDN